MNRPPEPLFLERQNYRRRRFGDAARIIPVIGLVLVLLPILWAEKATTANGLVYILIVWIGLIIGIAFVSRRLAEFEPDRGETPFPPGEREEG